MCRSFQNKIEEEPDFFDDDVCYSNEAHILLSGLAMGPGAHKAQERCCKVPCTLWDSWLGWPCLNMV